MTNSTQSDRRVAQLHRVMKRHRFAPDALIEILHEAQKLFGHLEADVLRNLAHQLGLPPSRVYGVATFYHLFRLDARRRHEFTVCLGTACYIRGANALLREAKNAEHDRGDLALHEARCVGTCGIAPLIVVDGAAAGPETPESLRRRLLEL